MMDSFEFTKYAGAALAALLLIFGTRTIMEINQQPGHGPAAHADAKHAAPSAGYTLPAAKEAAAADAKGGAPTASDATPAKVIGLLAAAKPENGQAIFKKCSSCHSADKGGKNLVGPALWGIVGRPKGGADGFGYSDAMKAKGGNWSFEDLAAFINSPSGFVKGTKMVFAGIPDAADAADLIAYLRAQSDSPVPLPGK